MTDVFISYKKEDAGRVIRLVEALRAEGLSVWWDHGIRAGSEWDRSIHQELYAARVVIAIWSEASVRAPWVKEEATVGKSRGVLLPIRIDEVDPPLGFMMIQAADLVGWTGDRTDPRWAFLLDGVQSIIRGEPLTGREAPLKAKARPAPRIGPILAGALSLAVAAGAALLVPPFLRDRAAAPVSPPPREAPAPVASAPAVPVLPAAPAAPVITANEQQLWDRAVEEKNRQGFQTYLVSYPNGAYAQRARDILLTCRTETREVWKDGPAVANQMLRGVGDTTAGMTPIQACAKAKADVRSLARNLCETISHNGGYRNPRWSVGDRDCDCETPSARVTICKADLAYSCQWEMKVTERLEICGG